MTYVSGNYQQKHAAKFVDPCHPDDGSDTFLRNVSFNKRHTAFLYAKCLAVAIGAGTGELLVWRWGGEGGGGVRGQHEGMAKRRGA
jgi:hypothetical protein